MGYSLLSGVLEKTDKIGALDALLLAVIGIAIVFVVLIALMLIVSAVGKLFDESEVLKEKHPEWGEKIAAVKSKMMFWKKAEEKAPATSEPQPLASGTCGELKLINTDERDAAMIMAIVADTTGVPLNELRFKSIKRLEEEK